MDHSQLSTGEKLLDCGIRKRTKALQGLRAFVTNMHDVFVTSITFFQYTFVGWNFMNVGPGKNINSLETLLKVNHIFNFSSNTIILCYLKGSKK